jgi:hypothetical protein
MVVVGTVNMDETTHGFSRKVLDRALTVECDAVDFSLFGGTPLEPWEWTDLPWTALSAVTNADDLDIAADAKRGVVAFLERWNRTMSQGPFRIAYRTINESLLIAGSLPDKVLGEVLDWVAMTKLLPRLEGDKDKLQSLADEGTVLDQLIADWPALFGTSWEHSRAKRKLEFMTGRLEKSGYTSFWP